MEVNLVSVPINEGSEIATPTIHVHTNCGEFKSHTTLSDMGISHPISASFVMAIPTNHVHWFISVCNSPFLMQEIFF